jgi:acyl transferase domain-containing protein
MNESGVKATSSSSSLTAALPLHEVINAIPGNRWDPDAPAGVLAQGLEGSISATRFGAFLQGVEDFDATAFGISSTEATAMDPQHRLLLASAAQLLAAPAESAEGGLAGRRADGQGAAPAASEAIQGSNTSVYVGISWSEYHQLGRILGQPVGANTAQGAVLSVACGRWAWIRTLIGSEPCLAQR